MHNHTHSYYVEQLQRVHMLRDQLELSDADYRGLLERLTGSRSAKHMTFGQRDKVIAYMTLHQALDEAVAKTEAARAQLSAAYTAKVEPVIAKDIFLDGQFVVRTGSPLEDVVLMMRERYGNPVALTGASERRPGQQTLLRLEFASSRSNALELPNAA